VAVTLSPSSVVANGASEVGVTAAVTDAEGHPVSGDDVRISVSDLGDKVGAVTPDGNGRYTATITVSKLVHTVTVTAIDLSVMPHVSGKARLSQTPGPPSHVTVALSPGSVVADGASTAAAATVTDANGNGVPGNVVGFSSSDPAERIGPVTDQGNGTYTATVTSSTAVGPATITATDSSVSPALAAQATLTQTVGPAIHVTVGLSPSAIVANGSSQTTATATVRDAEGHAVPGEKVAFFSTDPQEELAPATDHGNGTYTAAITSSTTAHQVTITGTDASVAPGVSGPGDAGPDGRAGRARNGAAVPELDRGQRYGAKPGYRDRHRCPGALGEGRQRLVFLH
jgi:hypothetical protein